MADLVAMPGILQTVADQAAGKRTLEVSLNKDSAPPGVRFVEDIEQVYLSTCSPRKAANESDAIWEIQASINNVEFSAIVDTGASICVVTKALWRQLNAPLHPSKTIRMRDANNGEVSTAGAMVNQDIIVGGQPFTLTIQVVDEAPYDCLLGVPFCKLAHATLLFTEDDLCIRVINPDTKVEVVVPAFPRGRAKGLVQAIRDTFVNEGF